MRIVDPILMELDREAATTKRVLERVPADKMAWRPHPKSRSLGDLALHVATIPGRVARMVTENEMEVREFSDPPPPKTTAELVSALDQGVASAKQILNGFDDKAVTSTWKMTKGGTELMTAPKIGVIRSVLLNHWYHHRGQLSVYLRLLNVPVPSIYGPSADENPFGGGGRA